MWGESNLDTLTNKTKKTKQLKLTLGEYSLDNKGNIVRG